MAPVSRGVTSKPWIHPEPREKKLPVTAAPTRTILRIAKFLHGNPLLRPVRAQAPSGYSSSISGEIR